MRFRVHGIVTVPVSIDVQADSSEDAIEEAYQNWPSIEGYAGNGAISGKLVGTAEEGVWVWGSDDEPTFSEAERRD